MSTYSDRVSTSEGQHDAESKAIGRLRTLADEYAGTPVGQHYEQMWKQEVTATYGADEYPVYEEVLVKPLHT